MILFHTCRYDADILNSSAHEKKYMQWLVGRYAGRHCVGDVVNVQREVSRWRDHDTDSRPLLQFVQIWSSM